MRKLIFAICAIMLAFSVKLQAQVTNYSLRLEPQGSVNFGMMPELDGIDSYSIQLWLNADEWTNGAIVYSRGNDFSLSLGETKQINFGIGNKNIKVSSDDFVTGNWCQITLLCDKGNTKVFVNQKLTTQDTSPALSQSEESFVIGGGQYKGRIDEVRIWKNLLQSDYNYFFNNTLNKWCPQWSDLVAYYKFDQDLCDNVVDYKTVTLKDNEYNHHGVFSAQGAMREKVTDNSKLPYLINGAYTANSRFFDRAIDREKYLLSNDLIILGIESLSDGHLRFESPNNHLAVTNGEYLSEFNGRSGVLSLNGKGAKATGNVRTFEPIYDAKGIASRGYTFETWLYLEEWTEGAYIFRKETDDTKNGFSIRLGEEATKQVIVRVNGNNFVNIKSMPVGEWVHFGVSVNDGGSARTTFLFSYNGVAKFANATVSDESVDYTPKGMAQSIGYLGENLKAKLDETVIWNMKFATSAISDHMVNIPMPGLGIMQTAELISSGNSYWKYDKENNLGYDSYSQDSWRAIMESAYEGYRGYKVRISVKGHDGWINTIADANKRKIFAADLAVLSKDYDGVELDLEWASDWTNYGYLADEIRKALPAEKSFEVSCHAYGSYRFPQNKMNLVNGFTFQQYGPQKTWFYYSQFERTYRDFVNYGFPKEKIYLSYSTTTSGPYDANDKLMGNAIVGVKNGLMDGDYVPNDEIDKAFYNGNYYYFDGYTQTYKRAKFCVDNNLMGLFYWDMGNDVPTTHKYSLVKACSFGLNSNVDSLITKVDIKHPAGIFTESTTIDKQKNKSEIKVIPNPVNDSAKFIISTGDTPKQIKVYTMTGACALVKEMDGINTVSLSNLSPGTYNLSVKSEEGNIYKTRFIKQ